MSSLVPFVRSAYAGALSATKEGGGRLAAVAASFGNNPTLALGEEHLPRLESKVIGDEVKWIIPDGEGGTTMVDEVVGIPIALEPRGMLWPYEKTSDNRPLLVTHDMVTAYQIGDDFGDLDPDVIAKMAIEDPNDPFETAYDWLAPSDGGQNIYAEFGTDSNGRGKRVKESNKLYLLRPGTILPSVVNIPATSFKNFKKLTANFIDAELPLFMGVISLRLSMKPNADKQMYAIVEPKRIGRVEDELEGDIMAFRKKYASKPPCAADYQPRQKQDNSPPADWKPDDDPMASEPAPPPQTQD